LSRFSLTLWRQARSRRKREKRGLSWTEFLTPRGRNKSLVADYFFVLLPWGLASGRFRSAGPGLGLSSAKGIVDLPCCLPILLPKGGGCVADHRYRCGRCCCRCWQAACCRFLLTDSSRRGCSRDHDPNSKRHRCSRQVAGALRVGSSMVDLSWRQKLYRSSLGNATRRFIRARRRLISWVRYTLLYVSSTHKGAFILRTRRRTLRHEKAARRILPVRASPTLIFVETQNFPSIKG